LSHVDWYELPLNNFECFLKNIERKECKSILSRLHDEIKDYVNCVPLNILSCLPKGGCGYLEVVEKYR